MRYEDRLAQELEDAILSNPWVGKLMQIKKDPLLGGKIDVRVRVQIEDCLYTGRPDWFGCVMVKTDEVLFQEKRILDYENWQTDAYNLGRQVYNSIIMRGLFVKEVKPAPPFDYDKEAEKAEKLISKHIVPEYGHLAVGLRRVIINALIESSTGG